MGRVEAVDACGLASPGRRVEQQKSMKGTQFTLKWLGKGSPDRNDVESIYASPARQPSQKADTGHRSRNLNPLVKQEEIPSVRTKIFSREQLLDTGRTGGRIIGQNPTKGEDDSFELFKKEFIEKLAEKAKERPGYLLANEDFVKPVNGSPKLFKKANEDFVKPVKPQSMLKQTDQEFVKAVKAHSGPKQSDEDYVKPLKAQPKLFKQTESLAQPSSLVGSQNSKKDVLERTMRIIESSRTFLQSSSPEKRKFSPRREKLSDPSWMSTSEHLNLSREKKAWSESKDIEETSRDFILNKFFQMPTRPTPSIAVDDVYPIDEEATPSAYSSRRRMLSTEHNAIQRTKIDRQQALTHDERQNVGQMTEQGEQSREDQNFDTGEILEDHAAQIRREMSKVSSGSPGRAFSSEDRRKDSPRSPGRKLSSEVKRNDSSRSPGRRILSQDGRKSPGRRTSPDEGRKESSPISTRSLGQGLSAEDLGSGTRGNSATCVLNESPVQSTEPKIPGSDTSSRSESKQKSVTREKEAMLKSVKKAAAVDQAHFLRALQDNGAVQSSTHMSRPSSTNVTKNSNNLKEARGACRVDAREDFPSTETRNSEPSPTGRRDTASFGSNRSREPSPTGRRDATSGSTNTGRTNLLRRSQSLDSSSPRSGEIQRNGSGERSQLPSRGNYPSCGSPRLSRQSSTASSIGTDEFEGGSIIEKLMRKASLRNSLSSAENQTTPSSVESSPNHRFTPPPLSNSKTGLRRTLSFADVNKDISKPVAQSPPVQTRPSSPTSGATLRRTCSLANLSEDLPQVLRKSSPSRANSVEEQSAAPPPAQQRALSNSLRVNVQVKESTIAKLKSRSSTSPVISDSQKLAIKVVQNVKSIEEPCGPVATEITTPERTLSPVTSSGSPWSPGSDDSSSEASGIEQPSPVSVLSYNNRRTPFQEDSRLSPLEHKLQVLHDRIRKSKTDVTNQKKARLEKIKAREAELQQCIFTKPKTDELLGVKVTKAAEPPTKPEAQAPQLHLASDVEEKKKPSARGIAVTRNEKLEKARPALPISDFSTSLETFDLKKIKPWTQDNKWDLVYIRDVLLVSNFGRDRSTVTKWHSVTDPMDPCLYDKLEDFYRLGKKFPGSQFLSRLAPSPDGGPSMQEYVQRVFFNSEASRRGAVDTMNRCHIFDAVNETLAKKLVPYIALPRPWMKPLAKPVVRPRPTGSTLMQEIWTDIYDQIGTNGSMSMDKAQLHQSLEDLIYEDLFKRTDLFPCREVERAAERVGIELERRILDDLLQETIIYLRKSV